MIWYQLRAGILFCSVCFSIVCFTNTFLYAANSTDQNKVTLTSPANGLKGQPTTLMLQWEQLNPYPKYTVQVARDQNFSDMGINQNDVTATSYECKNLPKNTTFYWRIQARGPNGNANWSDVWTFSTSESADITAPKLKSPADNAVNQPVTITVEWTSTGSTAAYYLQVSKTSSFTPSDLIIDKTSLTTTSFQIKGLLSANTKYYWRVNTSIQSATSPWSEIWNFTTEKETQKGPDLVSPPNTSTNQPLKLRFCWKPFPPYTNFTIQIASTEDFNGASIIVSNPTTDTTYEIKDLIKNTKYYWRVGVLPASSSTLLWSVPWTFTTGSEIIPPPLVIPQPIAPPQKSVQSPNTVNFLWSSVDSATSYSLSIATTPEFSESTCLLTKDNILLPSFTLIGLPSNKLIYWRVKAILKTTQTPWSDTWSFTTENSTKITTNNQTTQAVSQFTAFPMIAHAAHNTIQFKCIVSTTIIKGFLSIYNYAGVCVYSTTLSGISPSSHFTTIAHWNLKDSFNRPVPPGVYKVYFTANEPKGHNFLVTCSIGLKE